MNQDGTRRAAHSDRAPIPKFSYSQGVVVGDFLFVSGQGPIHPVTKVAPERFGDQVRTSLENVGAIAEAAGGRLADAVRVGVYLTDLANVAEMDAVYREYFQDPMPAQTTVAAQLRGIAVEIDAVIAIRPASRRSLSEPLPPTFAQLPERPAELR
jgi:2-iminobutanoate/2-iminopropanoate deaminase